ncbi:MAG TPA: hypothetical protein VG734_13285, partial [Lacunisphaera sp.]|nr:hypothetical protein [Lacunisphaera sp.]
MISLSGGTPPETTSFTMMPCKNPLRSSGLRALESAMPFPGLNFWIGAALGIFLIFGGRAGAAVNVSGDQTGNVSWTLANSPYTVTGNVHVPVGSTLTIEPGVSIKYAGAYQIYVRGTLLANGTSLAPIAFGSTAPGTSSG